MVDEFKATAGVDLVDAVREVLRQSAEPLTISKIRARLPAPLAATRIEELAETIAGQVAANVLIVCPK